MINIMALSAGVGKKFPGAKPAFSLIPT